MVTPNPEIGPTDVVTEGFFANDEGNEEVAAQLDDEVAAEAEPTPDEPSGVLPTPVVPSPEATAIEGAAARRPEPTPPAVPAVDERAKQRLAYLEQREREWQQQEIENRIQAEAVRYQRDLEAQGFLPEHAQYVAQRHQQFLRQTVQQQQQQILQQQIGEGKRNAAQHFAEKYGVSPSSLMHYDSPEAMEDAAKDKSRIRALEEAETQRKKAQVPGQRFDQSGARPRPGRPNRNRIADDVIAGRKSMTTEEYQQWVNSR